MQIFKYLATIISITLSVYSGASELADIKEYGIVMIPGKECIKKAVSFNQKIENTLKNESIEKVDNYWHITLYHGAYQQKDLLPLYKQLNELELNSFSITFTEIYDTLDRWIDWKVINNDELHSLHCKIVGVGSQYSQRPLKRSADIYSSLTDVQRKQVDKYGVQGILEYYTPHLTLFYAYPPNESLRKAVTALQPLPSNINCPAVSIAVGELGYNGNIINILYKIDLPSQ